MAKQVRRPDPVAIGHIRLPKRALLIGTALQACSLLVIALPAAAGGPAPNAQPTGGQVVAGSAAIGQTATQTTITQSSQRAAVNWSSFDVGSQQSVTFQQPSGSAVTLNRVTGPDPSQIAGHIQANGQVVLTNQSGVVFTKGAQVDTAGLIVSSAGISDRNFMAGRMAFDQPGKPGAAVVNEGTITVRQAGLAALVAPQVANSGTITAKLGHVVLGGARAATLDLYGDGLVSIDVTRQVTEAPIGPDGRPVTALVTNTGAIAASGGTVQLTAAAMEGVVTNLVTAGGTLSAATRHGRTGTIAVGATGGAVTVTGTLAANGRSGGQIQVNATDGVTLAAGSRVSVAGHTGGGTVALGTTLARSRGGPGVSAPAAKTVTVAAGATIVADATGHGNGGTITVLSSGHTQMDGGISATGGRRGGDGGFVEISGNTLGMTGRVDVSAPDGPPGTILLDPDFLTIVAGSGGSGTQDSDFTVNGGTVAASDAGAGANSISNGVINGFAGNVLLQANKTLTAGANIALTTNPAQSLTLEAGGTIAINPGVSVVATGNVILATGGAGPGTPPAAQPSPLIAVGGTVASLSGSVSLLGGTGAISIANGGALVSSHVDLGAAGGVTEAAGGIISTQTLTSVTGLTGPVSLAGTANAIGAIGGLNVGSGSFSLVDTAPLVVAGTLAASGVQIADSAAVTVSGSILPGGGSSAIAVGLTAASLSLPGLVSDGGAGTVSLVATGGGISQTGTLIAGTLSGSASGVASLTGFAPGINQVATLGNFSGSILGLVDGANLTIAGAAQGGSGVTMIGSGTVQVSGTIAPLGASPIAVGITATSIALLGLVSDGGGGTTVLSATTGGIAQTGTLISGTLSGASAGGTALTGAGPSVNQVASLGNFTAGTSFSLNDGHALIMGDTLQAGTSASVSDTASLRMAGTISPTGTAAIAVGLTATALDLPGLITDGGAGDLSLVATSGGISQTGTLIAGTVSGSATGVASLTGSGPGINQVGTMGNFSATVLGLVDADNLTIAGAARGSTGVSIIGSGTVLVSGTIAPIGASQIAIGVTAASIGLPGLVSDGGGGTTVLSATSGGIVQTGTLISGTLSGASAGGTALTGAGPSVNQVASLGNFTAGTSFSLNDGHALIMGDTLQAGTSASVSDTASLRMAGTISPAGTAAIAVGLTATALDLPGLITDGGAGTVSLVATSGNISQTGTLIAGTVSGSATGNASLNGSGPAINQVATLGNFSASGLSLFDAENLTIGGLAQASNAISIIGSGTVRVSGTIAPSGGGPIAIGVTATSIGLPGLVSDRGGTTVLSATSGGIVQTGTLISGTLSGAAAGSVAFTGAGPAVNQVATLGNWTAGGTFSLNDGQTLLVPDTLHAGSGATLADAANLQVSGTIAPTGPGAIAVGLTAASLTLPGLISDGGTGTTALHATSGSIVQTGTLVAGTLSGSAAVTFGLSGATPTANTIAALGPVTAGADLSVDSSASLAIAGSLTVGNGHTIALRATGLAIGAAVNAPNGEVDIAPLSQGGTISLDATRRTGALSLVQGDVSAIDTKIISLGSLSGGVVAGAIQVNGQILAGQDILRLNATGAIAGSGAIAAAQVTGQAASVSLTGANAIRSLGDFTAPGGFTLNNGVALAVTGTVSSGPTLSIADSAGLSLTGGMTATSVSLTAASLALSGPITAPGSVVITATAGAINDSGVIMAGTLSGSAATSADFAGANQVATLGNFPVTGSLSLNDATGLAVTGAVSSRSQVTLTDTGAVTVAGSLTGQTGSVTAASLTVSGTLTGTNSLSLTTTAGGITGTGTVTTAALTGSAATDVALTGPNQIAGLGHFTAGTSLVVTNTGPIAITGTVSGASLLSLTSGSSITETGATLNGQSLDLTAAQSIVLNGGTLLTGGTIAAGRITAGNSLIPSNGGGGALLTAPNVTQTGTLTIRGAIAIDPVAEIVSNGSVSLATLDAPQTWLILDMQAGRASASDLTIQRLDLLFTGSAVAAGLSGAVGGQAGDPAAEGSYILPQTNPNYILNGCPIASASCIVIGLTREAVPAQKPLSTIDFDAPKPPTDDPDLFQILPNISKQDY